MNDQREFSFDGRTMDEDPDAPRRLSGQMLRVVQAMADGRWRTLAELTAIVKPATEASVSARLRDLRKPKFGAHQVDRRLVEPGLYEYRVTLNPEAVAA